MLDADLDALLHDPDLDCEEDRRFSSYRASLVSEYSDLFKEVFGVRPRHYPVYSVSEEELKADLASLYEYAADEFASLKRIEEAEVPVPQPREEPWMDRAALMGAVGW